MAFLLMLLCGAAYGACFPPLAVRGLAWVVLAPAFVAILPARPARAAMLGAVLGGAGACATVAWLPRTVVAYFGQPWWLGALLFALVVAVMVLPCYAAVAACAAVFARRWRAALPLAVGAAWAAGELARARLLGGNPWVLFGYTQVGVAPVVQLADLAGVYGLSFVLAATNVAAAQLWLDGRRALGAGAVAVALVAGTVGYGAMRLAEVPRASAAPVPVAVVQGDIDLGAQWRQDLYGRNLDTYLRLTLDTLGAAPAALVVWPENAMTFFLADEPLYREAIARVLGPFGATLLAGGPAVRDRDVFTNAAFTMAPDGALTARYDKRRLLPFAESFPLPRLDLLRRNFGRVRSFTPGAASAPLPTPAGAAGVLICNEAFYPDDARARVREGATLLVNLSNDTWMGSHQFSTIAFDTSALRAVEQRRWLVRASTSGPSAIVDPFGHVVAAGPLAARAVVRGAVAPRTDLSPYARWGDAFAFACAAATLALLVAARR